MDFPASLKSGPHALLAQLAGDWRGVARLWFEPDKLHAEGPIEGIIEPIHGGRFMQHNYVTTIDGSRHEGSVLIGCDLAGPTWQIAWSDTFHTGTEIMFCEGPAADGFHEVVALGSYSAPDGVAWGWRTAIIPSTGRLLIRHWNITPDGDEALAVECEYAALGT